MTAVAADGPLCGLVVPADTTETSVLTLPLPSQEVGELSEAPVTLHCGEENVPSLPSEKPLMYKCRT